MSGAKAGRSPDLRLVVGIAAAALAAAAAAALPAPAGAATIEVRDNKPDAIQKAINRAENGDRLRIHRGHYGEDIVINKRLRLVGRGRKRPVIDGKCQTDETVDFAHPGITLKRVKVIGAAEGPEYGYNINIIGLPTATIKKVTVKETCDGSDSALYGINVVQSGNVEIRNVRAFGAFHDAGIYVGSISDTSPGPLVVARVEAYGNNVGIRVEDVVASTNVRVRRNLVHHNDVPLNPGFVSPAGIFLSNSDGVTYGDNVARQNGAYGIWINGASTANVFGGNRSRNNDVRDVRNDGGGTNCGAQNDFGSSQGPSINSPC